MKYISRLTALLAAALLVSTGAQALTLDGLTETQLQALYQAESQDPAYVTITPDVLGFETELSVEESENYTYQWYEIDPETGAETALQGETGAVFTTVYPLTEKRYYCAYQDAEGNASASAVYIVVAQTTDLEAYVSTLFTDYDNLYYVNEQPIEDYFTAAWQWMQKWNVTLSDGSNLAENVLAYWLLDPYPAELLCTCAGEGADFCILPADADHQADCGWYTGSPLLQLKEETDDSGNVSYTLYITVDGEDVVLAVSEMLDGKYHYLRDARQGELGLYVAYLKFDEEGTAWVIPLTSEDENTVN